MFILVPADRETHVAVAGRFPCHTDESDLFDGQTRAAAFRVRFANPIGALILIEK
jgi:hypothetical protein